MWYEVLVGSLSSVTLFSLFVSIPIYVVVLLAVASNRHVEPFGSDFFTVFIGLGVVDICCYFLSLAKKMIFFGFVPELFRPFNHPNKYCSYFYYPFWVFAFLQYQLTFIMTLNRHFSIVLPCYYVQHWSKVLTRRLICGSIFISCTLALPVLFADCQITEYMAFKDEGARILHYGPHTTDSAIDRYLKLVWAFHVYGLVLSSIVFYGFMLRKLRENSQFILKQKRKRVELQMFCVGFIVFLMNLAFTIYFVLRDMILIRIANNPHIHEWLLYFMADIYDLPNGYILWMLSDRVRRIVKGYLCNRRFLGAVEPLIFSGLSAQQNKKEDKHSDTDQQNSQTIHAVCTKM